MRKTIQIGDKEVAFEANASIILTYHQLFFSDYFYDVANALSYITDDGVDLRRFRSDIMTQIIYALAKCADDDIPAPGEWLSQFDLSEFRTDLIFTELLDLIVANNKTVKKN